jgi:hypothetical protein
MNTLRRSACTTRTCTNIRICYVCNRLNGDLLATIRERMEEGRERTELARKRNAAHLEEHRCDSPI